MPYPTTYDFCLRELSCGQARREKISERMKILQDLVPGCNKVWYWNYLKIHIYLVPKHLQFCSIIHLVLQENIVK